MDAKNSIEKLLHAAMLDSEMRPKFYQEFLESQVLVLGKVIGNPAEGPDGVQIFTAGSSLRLKLFEVEGQTVLPVFSSLKRLRETFEDEKHIIQVGVRILLQTIEAEVKVALNPNSVEGLEFSLSEIRAMLDGSILEAVAVMPPEAQESFHLKAPQRRPLQLTSSLSRFFKTCPNVGKAYLAQRLDPGPHSKIHYLAGIEFNAGPGEAFEDLVQDMELVAAQCLEENETIDFLVIDSGIISKFMLGKLKPFYRKDYWFKTLSDSSQLLHSLGSGASQAPPNMPEAVFNIQAPLKLAEGLKPALVQYFKASGAVAEAFLGCFDKDDSRLILGLSRAFFRQDDKKEVVSDLIQIFNQFKAEGDQIDILFLGNSPISSEIMKNLKPFYSRFWARWFNKVFRNASQMSPYVTFL